MFDEEEEEERRRRRRRRRGKKKHFIMSSYSDTDTGSRAIYDVYCTQNSPLTEQTSISVQAALLSKYPAHNLISTTCDLIAYANAGHAIATLNEGVHPTLRSWGFQPAAREPSHGTSTGKLTQEVLFGQFDYVWQDQNFRVFVVDNGRCDRRCYVLSPPAMTREEEKEEEDQVGSKNAEALVLAANIWSESSHKKVWVFDYGRWVKDKNLWEIIHSASWEDLILDEGIKRSIFRDVEGFFDAKETYVELRAPWKVSSLALWGPSSLCSFVSAWIDFSWIAWKWQDDNDEITHEDTYESI